MQQKKPWAAAAFAQSPPSGGDSIFAAGGDVYEPPLPASNNEPRLFFSTSWRKSPPPTFSHPLPDLSPEIARSASPNGDVLSQLFDAAAATAAAEPPHGKLAPVTTLTLSAEDPPPEDLVIHQTYSRVSESCACPASGRAVVTNASFLCYTVNRIFVRAIRTVDLSKSLIRGHLGPVVDLTLGSLSSGDGVVTTVDAHGAVQIRRLPSCPKVPLDGNMPGFSATPPGRAIRAEWLSVDDASGGGGGDRLVVLDSTSVLLTYALPASDPLVPLEPVSMISTPLVMPVDLAVLRSRSWVAIASRNPPAIAIVDLVSETLIHRLAVDHPPETSLERIIPIHGEPAMMFITAAMPKARAPQHVPAQLVAWGLPAQIPGTSASVSPTPMTALHLAIPDGSLMGSLVAHRPARASSLLVSISGSPVLFLVDMVRQTARAFRTGTPVHDAKLMRESGGGHDFVAITHVQVARFGIGPAPVPGSGGGGVAPLAKRGTAADHAPGPAAPPPPVLMQIPPMHPPPSPSLQHGHLVMPPMLASRPPPTPTPPPIGLVAAPSPDNGNLMATFDAFRATLLRDVEGMLRRQHDVTIQSMQSLLVLQAKREEFVAAPNNAAATESSWTPQPATADLALALRKLPQQLADAIEQPVGAAFKRYFTKILVPAFEEACRNMLSQLADLLEKQLKDYTEALARANIVIAPANNATERLTELLASTVDRLNQTIFESRDHARADGSDTQAAAPPSS